MHTSVAIWWTVGLALAVFCRAGAMGWGSVFDGVGVAAVVPLAILRLLSLAGRPALAEVRTNRAATLVMAGLVQSLFAGLFAALVASPDGEGVTAPDDLHLVAFWVAWTGGLAWAIVATCGEAGSRPLDGLGARCVLPPAHRAEGVVVVPQQSPPRWLLGAAWAWVGGWAVLVPLTSGMLTGDWGTIGAVAAVTLLALGLAVGLICVAARSASPYAQAGGLLLAALVVIRSLALTVRALPATPWPARVLFAFSVALVAALTLIPLSGIRVTAMTSLSAPFERWRENLLGRRESALRAVRSRLSPSGGDGPRLAGCDRVGCGADPQGDRGRVHTGS